VAEERREEKLAAGNLAEENPAVEENPPAESVVSE